MSEENKQDTVKISLGDNRYPVQVYANGVLIEVSVDGQITFPNGVIPDGYESLSDIVVPKQELMPGQVKDKYEIGTPVDGKGIYIGVWEPRDVYGKSLNKIFDLYAAPTDLQTDHAKKKKKGLFLTFNAAVQTVSDLQDFHAHDGTIVASKQDLFRAITQNPGQLERWFIPSQEILRDYLYARKLYFKDDAAFHVKDSTLNYYPAWYWGLDVSEEGGVCAVNFGDGRVRWFHPKGRGHSIRPVRAELRSGASVPRPMVMK